MPRGQPRAPPPLALHLAVSPVARGRAQWINTRYLDFAASGPNDQNTRIYDGPWTLVSAGFSAQDVDSHVYEQGVRWSV